MDEVDLPQLVASVSAATGRRFIFGGKLRQIKATVISPEKITPGEAYGAFLSILETNGMTVIPHGRFLKIVESAGASNQTTPVFGQATPVPDEDRYVTRIYRASHVDAQEASTVLSKFKSKDGDISVYAPGNLLLFTDTGTNIRRMLRILEELDVGGAGDQLWVEPIHYSSASEISNKLNEIFDLKSGKGRARIVADDRTNSLILTANQADYLRMLELIKRLDVSQTGSGEIHVLPLQHAVCKELSGTLNGILGRGGSLGSSGAGKGSSGARPAGGSSAPGGAPGGTGGAEDVFEGSIKVVCDEATNKLVITASLRDYAQLRTVIDQLDVPRRQVFIEAVVMDVNVDRVTDLGISYHGGAPLSLDSQNDSLFYGGNNLQQSVLGVPANLEALALGIRGPAIEGTTNLLPGVGLSVPALGVVLHALAKDGDTNVLATPHILATDNVEAEISIGQNIPLQTNLGGVGNLGSLLGAAGGQAAGGLGALGALGGLGGLGGFQAPRQDVGTKITVKPYVNDSDQVRLDLSEEISDAGAAVGALGAIPINKRTAKTTLIVKDQQTVVIGGLVRDTVVNAQTKIPILGDLPIIGALFRQSKKTTTKTNLLLVLTPYVIRDQSDLRKIFERKMQERQEFIDRYFVFGDGRPWEPPRDFSRTNGLVEDVRQSILLRDERRRVEEAGRPKGRLLHQPQEPIEMPSIGVVKPASAGGASQPAAQPGQPGQPASRPATSTKATPRTRPSGGGTVTRVE